ncbi:MAG: glycoside hydrolase family 15 protein, partial [Chthoniobacterales bacterium]
RQVYTSSLMVLAATEDKHNPGGFIASPTFPWAFGFDRTIAPEFGSYALVWPRDLYHVATALIAAGDRPAAIEAYRGILNVEPDGANDRVALAEIYAIDDPPRAIGELRKVLDRDIHHAPAYRLLASYFSRTSATERANRPMTARGEAFLPGGVCPFCGGNEELTPVEILAYRDRHGRPNAPGWR